MPTVWSERGFIFMIHTNDHEPAHIHAYKAGGVVLINVRDLSLRKVINLKKADVKLAKQIAADNRELFLQKWEEIHDN
jgi:hypothetical protein